jgi:hypothetical protein
VARCAGWALWPAVILLAGCGGEAPRADPAVLPRPSFGDWAMPSASSPVASSPVASPAVTTAASPAALSRGWEITVYYTAVERFHGGEAESVTGCRGLDCAHGDDDLGEFPAEFVAAVKDEGTGRTADGSYLNWSHDIGYWLDTAARDAGGAPLRPFVSAAADPDVLPRGTTFRIAACGHADDGSTPPAEVCGALRRARWIVTDEFTPGLGGSRHLDVYLGEETGPDFTSSPWYLSLAGASLRLG